MNRILLLAHILVLSFCMVGCLNIGDNKKLIKGGIFTEEIRVSDEKTKEVVTSLVVDFGSRLQNVSLLAPKESLIKSIQSNYAKFVAPTLLEEWISNPLKAPGRLTSSPWPDRIEILNSERTSENTYEVKGEIVEIISEERVNGGISASRPITLIVKKTGDKWLIYDVMLGKYEEITKKSLITINRVT